MIDRYTVEGVDPLSATARCDWRIDLAQGDWSVTIAVKSRMTADASTFRLEDELIASEGGQPVFRRSWDVCIPRDLT